MIFDQHFFGKILLSKKVFVLFFCARKIHLDPNLFNLKLFWTLDLFNTKFFLNLIFFILIFPNLKEFWPEHFLTQFFFYLNTFILPKRLIVTKKSTYDQIINCGLKIDFEQKSFKQRFSFYQKTHFGPKYFWSLKIDFNPNHTQLKYWVWSFQPSLFTYTFRKKFTKMLIFQ